MTSDKTLEALSRCKALCRTAITNTQIPFTLEVRQKLQHCVEMIDQVEREGWTEIRKEKAMRWLGFVQGVLHAFDVAPIEDLKSMNRPDSRE